MATMATHPDHVAQRLRQIIWYGLAAIFIGLPFHAFLITYAGAHLPSGVTTALRYWKEIILLGMAIFAATLMVRDKHIRQQLLHDRLMWLFVVFASIHLVMLMVFGAAPFAALLAFKINLGFLALYLIISTTQGLNPPKTTTVIKLILIPASIVGLFGLLQLTVLPRDVLQYFGYGMPGEPNPAYYLIENSETVRIMSTLWGPNQFGSYLVLPLILSLWWAITGSGRQRMLGIIVFLLSLISLYGSHSRGAWLAALVAICLLIFFLVSKWWRIALISIVVVSSAILASLTVNHKLPPRLEVLILHGPQAQGETGYLSSNDGHLRALTLGYDRLRDHPLGAGLEAAGRASEGLKTQLYTENYYLQLAVQTGYEGLGVFICILVVIAYRLRPHHNAHPMVIPLLAIFIGLSVNNLFAHTWSDGATAWLWWGLAGLVYVTRDKEIA
jgi:hypothetical protein